MSESLLVNLRELEERLFSASANELEELIAEDFTEIGSAGRFYDKAQAISLLAGGRVTSFTASNYSLRALAPGLELLSYQTCTESIPPVTALRNSVWRLQDGKWQITFHQGTILQAGP